MSDGGFRTESRTYGVNDPITIAFLAQLLKIPFENQTDSNTIAMLNVFIKSHVETFINDIKGNPCNDQARFYSSESADKVLPNAFIPLRVVQAYYAAHRGREPSSPNFRDYFEKTLHEQLSYSSIPDSRFDPAELAFCLEGLLLVQRNAVDPTLFRRVIEVLTKAQHESAFWRPTKPFLAQDNGMSLFPISVEVANSILRSCEIYDEQKIYDTFGSQNIGLFGRYWQWLRARAVRFKVPRRPGETNDRTILGWHSEHVNETGAIHTWETSQVLEFLLSYRNLLQMHIARTTLMRSRFYCTVPTSSQ